MKKTLIILAVAIIMVVPGLPGRLHAGGRASTMARLQQSGMMLSKNLPRMKRRTKSR